MKLILRISAITSRFVVYVEKKLIKKKKNTLKLKTAFEVRWQEWLP